MTMPQFLLKVEGDTVSKFDLKLCDKYEVVYEKRKDREESKFDFAKEDEFINVLLDSCDYGLPQT